ncbi:MAG: LacI family transcriptional regulator [Treponema sp.]|jgi:LacI family transcriptional regulator|nr:LacI family transcriptional regulator [Treponema sp.]
MTIKDIARQAHVSMMTVSNVINGKEGRVSKETAELVRKIIAENNYVPNYSARSLSSNSSHIISIIVPYPLRPGDETIISDPYVSTMLGEIEMNLRENGYFAMIRSSNTMQEIISMQKTWNADGVIFILPNYDDFIEDLKTAINLPMVFIDSSSSSSGILKVNVEDEKGTYLATKYLINMGHRKIAITVCPEGNKLLTKRYNGYRRALSECDLPFDPSLVLPFSPDYRSGINAGRHIAEDQKTTGITAVVTTSDISAIGVMEGARLGGLRIPADLSVIGFDNLRTGSYVTPKLTTIDQHMKKKADAAVKLLLDSIKGITGPEGNSACFDVELIERQSVLCLQ